MARRFIRLRFTSVLTTLIVLGSGTVVGATGYWNLPGTFCQWSGYGFGGGYHAPLMLGPITYECLSTPNDVRLPYAPNPYACAPYYGEWRRVWLRWERADDDVARCSTVARAAGDARSDPAFDPLHCAGSTLAPFVVDWRCGAIALSTLLG